jgi:hypothetical protein
MVGGWWVVLFLVGCYCSLFRGFSSFSGVRVLLVLLSFCGLALVVPVYLEAPYAFINKVFLLIKKNNPCSSSSPRRIIRND